jgi:membrane protease YdiL (CAAX protease family)
MPSRSGEPGGRAPPAASPAEVHDEMEGGELPASLDWPGRRRPRSGVALALVLAVATAWNLAANLWLPAALYVPGALAVVLALITVAVRVGGCGAADLGLDRRDAARGLAWGAVAAATAAAVLVVGAALPATRGLFEDRRAEGAALAALAYVAGVRVPFGTVALEETLFRGVLLGLGLRRWPRRTAVAASCLAFGLWHVLPARAVTTFNPVVAGAAGGPAGRVLGVVAAVAGTALAGLVFCWLRLRARSLLAPALLHAAVNGLGYALAFLVLRAR